MKQKNNIDLNDLFIGQEELKKLQEQFFLIFQNVSDGIAVQDHDRVVFANKAAAELDGFLSPEEIVGLPYPKTPLKTKRQFLDEKGKKINLKNMPIKKALRGEANAEGTFKILNQKTGEARWVSIKSMPIRDEREKVKMVITISRDITEYVMADEIKNDFLRMTSHELKTPITTIKAFSQILESMLKNSENKKIKEYFLKMDNQIDKLADLVENISKVVRLPQKKFKFNDAWFNFDTLVKEVVENTQNISNSHQLVVKGSTKKRFFGDKQKISQLFKNVINNAVKYSPNAKKVIIMLSANKNIVKVGIRDFGIGISPQHHKKIFKKFYRVLGTKDKMFPGIGLGLYESKQIAEKYKGKMWIESTEGKGSVFFLSLPIEGER